MYSICNECWSTNIFPSMYYTRFFFGLFYHPSLRIICFFFLLIVDSPFIHITCGTEQYKKLAGRLLFTCIILRSFVFRLPELSSVIQVFIYRLDWLTYFFCLFVALSSPYHFLIRIHSYRKIGEMQFHLHSFQRHKHVRPRQD